MRSSAETEFEEDGESMAGDYPGGGFRRRRGEVGGESEEEDGGGRKSLSRLSGSGGRFGRTERETEERREMEGEKL